MVVEPGGQGPSSRPWDLRAESTVCLEGPGTPAALRAHESLLPLPLLGFFSSDYRTNRFGISLCKEKYKPGIWGREVPSPPRCLGSCGPLPWGGLEFGLSGCGWPCPGGLGSQGGWRGRGLALASAKLHWGGPEGFIWIF